MSSKKEEKAEFNRLKKEFPNTDVSLDCNYESWCKSSYYRAYVARSGSTGSKITQGSTAKEAVDLVIKELKS